MCQTDRSIFILGLTGSIGMGKSTVSNFFKAQAIPVFDADETVYQLYSAGGAAVDPIGATFPDAVVDGAVDRTVLSKHVVGTAAAMKQLEAIVHPLVYAERRKFLQKALEEGAPVVVFDIPLLFETKAEAQVDLVAVVSAPPEVQRQRVLARPGMTLEKFETILARQVPDSVKRQRADVVIDTGCELQQTEVLVQQLLERLRNMKGEVFRGLLLPDQ